MSEQTDNLERVLTRIAAAIIEFFGRTQDTFFAEEMREYVERTVGRIAPGSPDRVMRDLRQRGLIDYEVLSRAASKYRIIRHAKQEELFAMRGVSEEAYPD